MKIYLRLDKFERNEPKGEVWSPTASKVPRFSCHFDNINDDPPRKVTRKKRQVMPFTSCVNTGWATRTFHEDLDTARNPTEYSIFNLKVPLKDLDEADDEYLADYDSESSNEDDE